MKLELEIIINKINVKDGYYSIEYTYILDGETNEGTYEDSYDGWTAKEWKQELKNGVAVATVLKDIADNYDA